MNADEAIVVKNAGSHFLLSRLPEWQPFPAVLSGKVRLKGSTSTNPVAVGDRVRFKIEGSEPGLATDPVRSSAAHPSSSNPLMRTRYCIRYDLGLCPVHQGAKETGPLFLLNNGRRLALGFDCSRCEMTVSAE